MRAIAAFVLTAAFAASARAQDTTVIRSTGPGVWQNPRLVEELRIGVLDGDERYIFGSISYIEVTDDGSMWVVDAQGPRVRIYDRSGRYVRDVFRTGSGPGEIKGVMGIDITPDGRVAIWDLPNHRVSRYRQDGSYVDQFVSESGWWRSDAFRVDTAGRYWVYISVRNPACVRRYTAPDGSVREIGSEAPGCGRPAYLRYSPSGQLSDTTFIPIPQVMERIPGFVIMLPEGNVQPFVPEWDFALSPHGDLITAHSSRYAINIVRDAGDGSANVTRIERDYEPVRIAGGERSDWEGRATYYTRREPRGASAGVEIPEFKPALRSVSVDVDGRIWVDRYVAAVKRPEISPGPTRPDGPPALTWREPRTFDVFESSGRFLGTVVAPDRTRFLLMRGNLIWAVARGEFDENYVVRYRLETDRRG